MNIKVTADSTCDLPAELLEKYDIDLIPLIVVKGGEEFLDNVTVTPADIFDHVSAGGSLCSTAARSVSVFQEVFARYADKYDAVIHVNIGSGFSSSYQNAWLAAQEFPNVRVIDSANLTTGQGYIALKALEFAPDAEGLDSLCARLNALTANVETSFVLDRLDYMVKGGRCSATAALGANLLNLKPCIELKDGKLNVGKKYRGSYEKCLLSYFRDRLTGREDIDRESVFLVYTQVPDATLNTVRKSLAELGGFRTVYEAVAGCTISCHCGPGTLGIIFLRKETV